MTSCSCLFKFFLGEIYDSASQERQDVLWRATLSWGLLGLFVLNLWGQSGWHIGTFTLTTWDELLHRLVSYFWTSPWIDFIASNFIPTQVRFKVTLLAVGLYYTKYQHLSVTKHQQETWLLQAANPSLWIILGVMWLELVIQGVCLLQSEENYRAESDLAPTKDRKGLLSLSFAWVVFTPLSRIIPAWNGR